MNDNDSTIPLAASGNAILSTFSSRDAAARVLELLAESEQADGARLYEGEDGINQLNTSSQWFADTEKELGWFQRQLAAGMIALFVPIQHAADHKQIVQLLRTHGVDHMTHFGEWTTERVQ